jgi:LCP family protein required for cell wall assembly
MVGSDSRAGLTKKEQKELKTGKDEGAQRTDTIMIVHIGTDGKTTIVSIPRDSYVKIPAHTSSDGTEVEQRKNKINAAYSFGGAPLLVETVELNTGLHIDHYMEVGFAGVRDLTDAVGGVDICVPQDYQDENSGLDIKEGCQRLDGKTALAYVRMRYADPTGDIGRIGRQQQFVSALLHRSVTPGVALHPIRAKSLAQAGVAALVVGENDGVRDLAKFAMAMRQITQGKGEVVTVPISDPDAQTAAGSSVLWDKKKAKKLFVSLGAPS